jgi:dimethylglycine dehydrogenase
MRSKEGQKEQLHCIDFEGEIYLREERGAMLMGTICRLRE